MFKINFDYNCLIYFSNDENGHLIYKENPINIDDKGVYFKFKNKKEYLTEENCVNYDALIENNLVEE